MIGPRGTTWGPKNQRASGGLGSCLGFYYTTFGPDVEALEA